MLKNRLEPPSGISRDRATGLHSLPVQRRVGPGLNLNLDDGAAALAAGVPSCRCAIERHTGGCHGHGSQRKMDHMANDDAADAVYNYYSGNDKVLKYLYTVVQAGSVPAGLRGFGSKFPKIKDRNVSRIVKSHSDYFSGVDLV